MLSDSLARVVPAQPVETEIPAGREHGGHEDGQGLHEVGEGGPGVGDAGEDSWEDPAPPRQVVTTDDNVAAATANEAQVEEPEPEPEIEPLAPPVVRHRPGADPTSWDAQVVEFAGRRLVAVTAGSIRQRENPTRREAEALAWHTRRLLAELAEVAMEASAEGTHCLWRRGPNDSVWHPADPRDLDPALRRCPGVQLVPLAWQGVPAAGLLITGAGGRGVGNGFVLAPAPLDLSLPVAGACLGSFEADEAEREPAPA